ncbi:MAG: HyaD/HybD family hydrogenase maturation endopeptidase [Gemmatimonadales bacterium]|jgi:hydrogenase maturation protease|nr:HyaD/HybD family hydrogenase maturation endopeptidase [Gemmatimonadales bacterium]
MNSDTPAGTVVIGLGNPLMGDDGLGLVALQQLEQEWTFDPPVELLDGGTWGMNLLHEIERAERLLFIDAINAEAPPGASVVVERDALPKFFALKLSPHQIDLKEVLALAELRGTLPEQTVAYGLQPAVIELSTELSPVVRDGVGSLISRIIERLERWGHQARPRVDR